MQVSWWNLVRFPNPLAFGSQAGTLSSETALVLGRPCWLEWNRNNWLESEINRMALELLLDLLVSTSEKKNTDWLRELNYEAFKLFSKHIGVLCMVCVQGVSLCVLVVSAPLIWWNPSCPSWAIAVCLIAVPLHSRQESPYPHNPLYKFNRRVLKLAINAQVTQSANVQSCPSTSSPAQIFLFSPSDSQWYCDWDYNLQKYYINMISRNITTWKENY